MSEQKNRLKKLLTMLNNELKSPIKEVSHVTWNTFGYALLDNQLKAIGFYKQPLERLPYELFKFLNIQTLSLTGGGLKIVPKEIQNLQNLEELYIGGNLIQEIPEELGLLDNLRVLYLLEDNLGKIPESLENLKNLKECSISSKKIKIPPKILQNLKSLGCNVYLNEEKI